MWHWLMQMGRKRKPPAKEFVQESYPVVSITRSEILVERCRGGIKGMLLVQIPERMLIDDTQVIKNPEVLSCPVNPRRITNRGLTENSLQMGLGLFRCGSGK
jgi:hypothetical protein